MRILFLHRDLPPDSYTGVAIQVHRLANALCELGHEVWVRTLSARPADGLYGVVPARTRGLGAALALAPCLKRFWHPLWNRGADSAGFDAVHVHGDGGFLSYRGNCVRTFYGTAGLEREHARGWKGRLAQGFSYWMEKREARRCRVCVGISPHIAAYLPGVDRVIPCIAANPPVAAGPSQASARTAFPSLLFLGSIGSRKRGELALSLFRALQPRFPGLRMDYVGPASDAEASAKDARLAGIRFHNRLSQEQLTGLYREDWIHLNLSSYEGFGVGIAEAMANGCVVVATPHPGSDFLVRDGVNGLVCEPAGLEAVVSRALSDASLREALRSRALEAAKAFVPRQVALAYAELYAAGLPATAAPASGGAACP